MSLRVMIVLDLTAMLLSIMKSLSKRRVRQSPCFARYLGLPTHGLGTCLKILHKHLNNGNRINNLPFYFPAFFFKSLADRIPNV